MWYSHPVHWSVHCIVFRMTLNYWWRTSPSLDDPNACAPWRAQHLYWQNFVPEWTWSACRAWRLTPMPPLLHDSSMPRMCPQKTPSIASWSWTSPVARAHPNLQIWHWFQPFAGRLIHRSVATVSDHHHLLETPHRRCLRLLQCQLATLSVLLASYIETCYMQLPV